MYFDDFEAIKSELELAQGKRCLSASDETLGRIRKCRSCTDFQKITDSAIKRKFSPSALLCYAVVARDMEMLKKLLDMYPAHVNNLTDQGYSPLHLAALDGNIDMMDILLKMNADINLSDSNGQSVLDYAAQYGQFDASQYLIERGSDLSSVRDGLSFMVMK